MKAYFLSFIENRDIFPCHTLLGSNKKKTKRIISVEGPLLLILEPELRRNSLSGSRKSVQVNTSATVLQVVPLQSLAV